MGLDRQQRVAVLSTGQQLRYSLLLLTAGLQDQTLARITAGDEAEGAPVASAQALAELTCEVSEEALQKCIRSQVARQGLVNPAQLLHCVQALQLQSSLSRHLACLPAGSSQDGQLYRVWQHPGGL